jgi:RNA polymerase sigma factor (sigma-70 family)
VNASWPVTRQHWGSWTTSSRRWYGLAIRVTRDWAAAEDITQEVFVRVWEDPQAFDPARGTWRRWLGTMTHRRAVDWVRRSTARRRRTAGAAPPIAAPDPEETAVAGSVAKSVQAAVDGQVSPLARAAPARHPPAG